MSAFMQGKVSIDLLAAALTTGEIATEDPTTVGRLLWREQLNSLRARYPYDASGERPGPNGLRDEHVLLYEFTAPPAIDNNALLGVADCYDYQSCEHDGWLGSVAHAWVRRLADGLRRAGAKSAGWDLPARKLGLPLWRDYVATEREALAGPLALPDTLRQFWTVTP